MAVWQEEFSKEWAVDPRIMSLVRQDVLEETSWHNDVSPSFGGRLKNGKLLRLWVEHPNVHRRESGSPYRYLLVIQPDFGENIEETILETDDLDLVLEALMKTLDLHGQKPKWRLLE